MRKAGNKVYLEISDIGRTSEREVEVVLRGTREKVSLPRSETDFFPGTAVIPVWLANKILKKRSPKKIYPIEVGLSLPPMVNRV